MSTTLLTAAQGAAGLALLTFGGSALVRGASALAARLGVSPLAIGLTVVAFGTSAPELVVSVDAAMAGANDISVGNVVGSNIANVALILGLSVLLSPARIEAKIIRIDAPILIGVSLALLAVLANGTGSRLEGAVLLAGLAAYTAFTFRQARREAPPVAREIAGAGAAMAAEPPAGRGVGLPAAVLFVIAGLGMLVAGGHLLVVAAVEMATGLGVSQAVIGLTIVAVGTSLPEAATSIVAAWRGQGDIAVGNVIGSNIFNILGILGVSALIRPFRLGAITWIDLGVMAALAVVLAVLVTTGRRLNRVEGALLLGGFVAYTAFLIVR